MRGSWGLLLAVALAVGARAHAQDGTSPPEPGQEDGGQTGAQDAEPAEEARSEPEGPLPVPRPAYVGMYFMHVPELSLESNSYLADFYLWFRWQGDDMDPSSTFEFMNLVEGWDVMREAIYVDDDGEPRPDDLGGGWRYQVFHVQGRFGHPFDIRAYPFDSQEIVVTIEDTEAVVADMVYVPDEDTRVVHPELEIPGWILSTVNAEVVESSYPTNFGDTRRARGEDVYSRFRYAVRVERPVLGYSATTILPIAIVMLITMVMFLIESKYFEGRLGLGITSLISAVALQLTASSDLPRTGYLVLLDHVYNISYAIIFLSLLESVASVRLYDRGEIVKSRRLDLVTMAGLSLFFFGGVGLLVALR